MEQSALLVPKAEIEKYVGELLKEEESVVDDLRRILPHVKNETLHKSLERRLQQGQECLKALQEGFVPLDTGHFTRVDVKDKWSKKWVKETLDLMPDEVKETWKKVEEKGIFKTFAVTTSGGDPILVGRAGKKNFFIAGWINFGRRASLGVRVKV